MPEKLEKLHLYICIVAALVVTVISIVMRVSLYQMSVWVSVSIVLFYGLGQMIRLYLINRVFQQEADEENGDALMPDAETDMDADAEADANQEELETDEDAYANMYDTNNFNP